MTLFLLFLIIAFILFLLDGLRVVTKVNLFSLGWAFVVLAVIFQGGKVLIG